MLFEFWFLLLNRRTVVLVRHHIRHSSFRESFRLLDLDVRHFRRVNLHKWVLQTARLNQTLRLPAKVVASESPNQLHYIRVRQIFHDLDFFKLSVISLVSEFLFLKWDWLQSVNVPVVSTLHFSNDSKCPPTQHLNVFEVINTQSTSLRDHWPLIPTALLLINL